MTTQRTHHSESPPPPGAPTPRLVTARRAAELTGLNERTIRRMIARGDLAARKVAVNRFLIDPADLPARKRNRLRDEIDQLRSDLDALTRRVRALERGQTAHKPPDSPYNALRADSEGFSSEEVSSISPPLQRAFLDRYSALSLPAPALERVCGRVSDVQRFAERHGLSFATAKGWRWLRQLLPIGEHDLLNQILAHYREAAHRAAGVHLRRCDLADCPCQQSDLSA